MTLILYLSVDGEKLFLQFLLAVFLLAFIFIVCWPMRVVAHHYKESTKKITELKSRVGVVASHGGPVCENVLYHHVVRHRHSLIAGYLKDLINEKQYEPEKCSNFFKDFSQISSNVRGACCSKAPLEKFDPIHKLKVETYSGKENSSEDSSFDELSSPRETPITKNNVLSQDCKMKEGRKKEFRIVKSSPESRVFKTLEGPTRRLRSNIFQRKKTKVPRWNVMQGLNNVHDVRHENLTVCTALINTRSPFKAKSFKNSSLQKVSHLALKSSYAKKHPEKLVSTIPSVIGDVQNLKDSTNTMDKVQETNVENGNVTRDIAVNNSEVCSVGSSGCESDCESEPCNDQSPQVLYSNPNSRQKIPLTTINEESAEENCPSE